ncbi:tyrosine-type recombinase/integrase [Gallicola sp. Sow4_E12]|uniref:tyrosine-type recombinase/integrase n=1 Tax=Gallicola sp. Sow4_E12 TaxID=3438785 RepID=UPI003F923B0E
MERGSKKAGFEKIRIHDLRHSDASMLIHLGVNPVAIAKRLGHDKVETTLNTYSHLYPKDDTRTVDLLEEFDKNNKIK